MNTLRWRSAVRSRTARNIKARATVCRSILESFLEGEHDPHRLTVHGSPTCRTSIVNVTAERHCSMRAAEATPLV